MVKLVREAFQQGKVVAAICHAGWMLASAGILKGKKATSFFAIKDDVVNAGATWVDQEVVVDGTLITSRKPGDLPAFCREIVRALSRDWLPATPRDSRPLPLRTHRLPSPPLKRLVVPDE